MRGTFAVIRTISSAPTRQRVSSSSIPGCAQMPDVEGATHVVFWSFYISSNT